MSNLTGPGIERKTSCAVCNVFNHYTILSPLYFKGKSKKVVNPEILPLPTTSKISHVSVAGDASHAILIAETGEVYFVGTSSRGEDGEVGKWTVCVNYIVQAALFRPFALISRLQ